MNYKIVWVDTDTDTIRRQWILPLPIVVGRCPTADITIDDASISRRHCQFMLDPHGTLVVRDLGAKNGVYVDQRKVDKVSVRPGSDVRLGLVTLRAELTDEELQTYEKIMSERDRVDGLRKELEHIQELDELDAAGWINQNSIDNLETDIEERKLKRYQ